MGRWITEVPSETPPGVSLWWRFHHYRRFLRASEPGTRAAALSEQITAEAARLEAAGLSLAARVAELEAFLADHGVLERARAWADKQGPKPIRDREGVVFVPSPGQRAAGAGRSAA